jgi:Helix-turn-helix domain
MTILDEVKLISRTSKQCRAIARYLEEHGEVDNVAAIMGNIPDAGRVLRLGARIFDLRAAGYQIETRTGSDNNTVYQLISTPAPRQLSLV